MMFLKNRVYYAARDDLAKTLYSLLNELNPTQISQLLNEPYDDDGQQCTPLIIAARYGHESTVRMLVKFNPNLEQEGTVKFDGYIIEGASALWCAAGAGHLNVVKILVQAGANINHPTRANSTPLRAACFDGRLDIVKYLVDHYANIHIANKFNNTCLMIAAYKGHLDVVSFLLENGANPNEKADCGTSALLFAAETGNLSIVKELLRFKAQFIENDVGMNALKAAAEKTRAKVVEYLVNEVPEIGLEERIEALELLGASYANDKDNYSLENAYKYLYKSMCLRYKNGSLIVKKKLSASIPAYQNWLERQNLSELQAISGNPNSLHMESLTIRERILGSHNPEVPHPVIFRGAVLADNAQFDRCIALWQHALELRQKNYVSVMKDILRFAQVFSQMMNLNVRLPFTNVMTVLHAAIIEIERNRSKLRTPGPKDDIDSIVEEMEGNLITCLYLITILTKLTGNSVDGERLEIYKMIYALNQLNISMRDGQTLLHLSCNSETHVDDFHTNDICRFPCADTVELLIRCGADVNAMDIDRNTPLHIIAHYNKAITDFATLYAIIARLINAGAHTDCVNSHGKTPLGSSASEVIEIIFKTYSNITLKCLAAKAIKEHNLTYQGIVPYDLESFIELHGTGCVKLR